MKELEIGGTQILVKDYHCAPEGTEEYLCKAKTKLWLYVNLTTACPARCPYCINADVEQGVSIGETAGKDDYRPSNGVSMCASSCPRFDLDQFQKTLNVLNSHVYGVSLTGGEPMMNPELLEDVLSVIERTVPDTTEIDMVTNGLHCELLPGIQKRHRLSSIHISRHGITDLDNNRLFQWKAPSWEKLKQCLQEMEDPGAMVLNCVLQKGGVENKDDLSEYLTEAAKAGIQNVSFVSLAPVNAYCTEHFVSPKDLNLNADTRFRKWNAWHDHKYCQCENWDFSTEYGWIRFYFRVPGEQGCQYCRQFVYMSDNTVLAGFGGPGIDMFND